MEVEHAIVMLRKRAEFFREAARFKLATLSLDATSDPDEQREIRIHAATDLAIGDELLRIAREIEDRGVV